MAAAHPFLHGISLRRDLGHLDRIDYIPVAVQIVPVQVEAHAAAGHAVGIAKREDLPDYVLAQTPRFVILAQEGAHGAFAHPGAARFPTVLAKHQPHGLLWT